MEDLQGDLAVVAEVVRDVDGGHAAGAHLALDGVAVREGRAKGLRDVHRSTADGKTR
jgi:hypothetical protein